MGIQITYYGHSCFIVSCDGYRVALDPYAPVPGYAPLQIEAEEVLCSHEHSDHGNRDAVRIAEKKASPFTVKEYDIPHDDAGGSLRGMNKIRVFEAQGIRVAHFGDIGCELPEDYVKELSRLDAAMVPVGGTYTINAAAAAALRGQIHPRVFIPMHYRHEGKGFPVISTLEDFLKIAGNYTMMNSNTVEITDKTPEGIVVLQFPKES